MSRLLVTVVFCLASTAVAASTFELSDPANEIYEEKQAAAQPREVQRLEQQPFCVMDTEVDRCWCFDRNTGDQLEIAPEECVEHAEETSEKGAR
jgi:hypothetical protein